MLRCLDDSQHKGQIYVAVMHNFAMSTSSRAKLRHIKSIIHQTFCGDNKKKILSFIFTPSHNSEKNTHTRDQIPEMSYTSIVTFKFRHRHTIHKWLYKYSTNNFASHSHYTKYVNFLLIQECSESRIQSFRFHQTIQLTNRFNTN